MYVSLLVKCFAPSHSYKLNIIQFITTQTNNWKKIIILLKISQKSIFNNEKTLLSFINTCTCIWQHESGDHLSCHYEWIVCINIIVLKMLSIEIDKEYIVFIDYIKYQYIARYMSNLPLFIYFFLKSLPPC